MYLKMLLADQLIEERFVYDARVYKGDHVQALIEQMIDQHEYEIERCGYQPQFILSQYPTNKKKERLTISFFSKLSFLLKIFG
jgi:hypothetical protein